MNYQTTRYKAINATVVTIMFLATTPSLAVEIELVVVVRLRPVLEKFRQPHVLSLLRKCAIVNACACRSASRVART
eukprot:3997767-Pleurochrysis_carterae.AAC.1